MGPKVQISSVELPNYHECVEDPIGMATLEGNTSTERLNDNTASLCTSRCKERKNIFSGTKDKRCICGNEIKKDIFISSECDTKCPGDEEEICGGTDSVSLRRTGYVEETTVTPRSTEQTTSSKISLTSLTSEIHVTSSQSEIPLTSSQAEILMTSSVKTNFGTNKTEGSQMTALYIALPVVIVAAVAIALIVCLILRYRRQKDKASVKRLTISKYEQDSNYRSLGVEVTAQKTNADNMCNAYYSTVSGLNDTLENNQDYDELNAKQATGTKTHAIYSHLKLKTGIPNSNTTDNTYSHIGSASKVCRNKTDNAYNAVQFSQRAENTEAPSLAHGEDQNPFYDTAKGQNKGQVNEMSEYAHINAVTT